MIADEAAHRAGTVIPRFIREFCEPPVIPNQIEKSQEKEDSAVIHTPYIRDFPCIYSPLLWLSFDTSSFRASLNAYLALAFGSGVRWKSVFRVSSLLTKSGSSRNGSAVAETRRILHPTQRMNR